MEHTPGPWVIDEDYHYSVNQASDTAKHRHIAMVNFYNCPDPEMRVTLEKSRANANLIAAAPDLLAACEDLDAALMVMEDLDQATYDTIDDYLSENIIDLRKAIAKAKGDQ